MNPINGKRKKIFDGGKEHKSKFKKLNKREIYVTVEDDALCVFCDCYVIFVD